MSLKTGILVRRKGDPHVRGIWVSKNPEFLNQLNLNWNVNNIYDILHI